MESTTSPVIAGEDNSRDLRAHYEALAQQMLQVLWRRRRMVVGCIAAAILIAIAFLIHMGPRYTTEALIQLDFNGGPSVAKDRPAISVNAVEVVKSTERVLRSRAVADAVVARLGLDKDPHFDRLSLSTRVAVIFRWLLGLQPSPLTPRGVAVDNLMRQVQITTAPRSYVVSVTATAGNPDTASLLANAVASEYMRQQMMRDLIDQREAARSRLDQIGLVYGRRLPVYQAARARLEELIKQVRSLRAASSGEVLQRAVGQGLIPAQRVMQPSGPNVAIGLALAIVLGFAAAAGFARYNVQFGWLESWCAVAVAWSAYELRLAGFLLRNSRLVQRSRNLELSRAYLKRKTLELRAIADERIGRRRAARPALGQSPRMGRGGVEERAQFDP